MAFFCYVWEYEVASGLAAEFEAAYGPEGEWVRLFRRDPAYVRTELYRDSHRPQRYLTLDFWQSRAARDAFRERFRDELEAVDARCSRLTASELHVGDFDPAG